MFPNSEPVPHKRRSPRETNDFVFAMGLWCNAHGISRKQYESLHQILKLLKTDINKLNALPETVGTLKKHAKQTLPLLEVRKKAVALNPEKLSIQRQARAIEREGFDPKIAPTKNLYFFNLADITKRILQSDLVSKMHFGLAELVNNPTQLWHTKSWASSIRTTSGQFARYPALLPGGPTEPILPSDCVEFFCFNTPCACLNRPDGLLHRGFVSEVYTDKRSEPKVGLNATGPVGTRGDIVLKVFQLWDIRKLTSVPVIREAIRQGQIRNPPGDSSTWKENEHVLAMNPFFYLPVGQIVRRFPGRVILDYSYMSSCHFDDDNRFSAVGTDIYVRRIISNSVGGFMPIGKTPPCVANSKLRLSEDNGSSTTLLEVLRSRA